MPLKEVLLKESGNIKPIYDPASAAIALFVGSVIVGGAEGYLLRDISNKSKAGLMGFQIVIGALITPLILEQFNNKHDGSLFFSTMSLATIITGVCALTPNRNK